MNENIKFWYPIKTVGQIDFEGHTHFKSVIAGEGHIVYMDVLLCRQSREKLKHDVGAKTNRSVQSRVDGVGLCSVCEKKYKANQNLAWQKWISSVRETELHGVK